MSASEAASNLLARAGRAGFRIEAGLVENSGPGMPGTAVVVVNSG
jgi:hypothetical protein